MISEAKKQKQKNQLAILELTRHFIRNHKAYFSVIPMAKETTEKDFASRTLIEVVHPVSKDLPPKTEPGEYTLSIPYEERVEIYYPERGVYERGLSVNLKIKVVVTAPDDYELELLRETCILIG